MNVRRSIAAAAIVLAAPMLASCGFGEQTDQVYNAAVGVDDRSGEVDILNALVVSGTDGSGTVVAGLVNKNENQGDVLTNITGGDPAQNLTVSSRGSKNTIPAGGMVSLADKGQWSVTGQDITPGKFVKLTFSFAHAQSVTVDVPVESASNPDYKNVPLPQG